METSERNAALEPLIGEWRMEMLFPEGVELPDVDARVTFEWRGDRAFVLERWTVPLPEAPDGLAVIRWDEGRGTFLQHYFDERGVARVYELSLEDGVWRMERTTPDFSDFNFSQRFTGTFSDDGSRIDCTFEIAHDHETWEKDFDAVYTRVS
ncbi:MAG: hypothetical protein HOQ03_08145 [Thermoleophilia bacterium]|nr:hypothetical protein [Thermoleophilia bacterium]